MLKYWIINRMNPNRMNNVIVNKVKKWTKEKHKLKLKINNSL